MTAEPADTVREKTEQLRGPTPEDDERLRAQIRAELDRQHAMPLARRTLELLAEAEVEPSAEEPGYRVIDRSGQTRLIRDNDAGGEENGDVTAPMTLRGLVAELRERHPDLFAALPEPETVDPVPPPPPEPSHDTLADVKAAGTRLIETQSALARSLAAHSAERGRTLATAASGRLEGLRLRLGESFRAKPAPVSVEEKQAEPPPVGAADAIDSVRPAGPGEGALAGLVRRGRAALPAIDRHGFDLHRVAFLGLAGATVLVIGLVVFTTPRRADDTSPPVVQKQDVPKETPKPAAEARSDTGSRVPEAKPLPEAKPPAPEPAPEDAEAAPVDETPRNPGDLAGVPQVIDTATLKLSGKVIHLFGVEWVRGGQADELTKYIRGRSITCRPAQGSSAFLCSIEGRDLSEVVLFNGGGRASSEASPDLVAAEDHARSERLGVWKR